MAQTHAARKTGNRPQHGLTLLEVTIVVAITAVVASVAAPSLGALIDARRVDSAATRLSADIQLARSEAIARNRPLRLSPFSGTGATCWIVHSGAAADCRCSAAAGAGFTLIETLIAAIAGVLSSIAHPSLEGQINAGASHGLARRADAGAARARTLSRQQRQLRHLVEVGVRRRRRVTTRWQSFRAMRPAWRCSLPPSRARPATRGAVTSASRSRTRR